MKYQKKGGAGGNKEFQKAGNKPQGGQFKYQPKSSSGQ